MHYRCDVWMVNLSPVHGHEQGGDRPALIVSHDELNSSPSGLVTVVPVTSTIRGLPLHIVMPKGTAGLTIDSVALCDQVRTISKTRMRRKIGTVPQDVMVQIEDRLRIHLDL